MMCHSQTILCNTGMKFSACMTPAYCRSKALQFLGISTNTGKVVSLPQNWLGCRGGKEKNHHSYWESYHDHSSHDYIND
jgi:hypothetical protein